MSKWRYFIVLFQDYDHPENIELSKEVISPNILIKLYLDLLFYYLTIIPFLSCKTYCFAVFLSTHGNNSIYNSYNTTSITKFLGNWNSPAILNSYSKSSTHPKHSVVSIIHNYPISSEYQLHKPFDIEEPYENLELSLRGVGMSETEVTPVISYVRNKNPMIICDFCVIINLILDHCMAHGPEFNLPTIFR